MTTSHLPHAGRASSTASIPHQARTPAATANRVVVEADGSDCGLAALSWARAQAGPLGLDLDVCPAPPGDTSASALISTSRHAAMVVPRSTVRTTACR